MSAPNNEEPPRLVVRDPEHDAKRDAAMHEGTMARRYRTAYVALGLFVLILLGLALRAIGVF